VRFSFKENRIQFIGATGLHRRKGSAVVPRLPIFRPEHPGLKIETWATHSTFVRALEKHFHEGTAEPQISPLRCAPVEMTKGREALSGRVVAERESFFHHLGWARWPMTSLSKINLRPPDFEWVAQVSLLRPGFPLRNRSYRNTHSIFVRAIFIFLGGPQVHRNFG